MPLLPKRRWLRFSIRTLLIAVTIFCMWLGWQWRIVEERRAMRALIAEKRGGIAPTAWAVPATTWLRALLGDEQWSEMIIVTRKKLQPDEEDGIARAFPEADLRMRWIDRNGMHEDFRASLLPRPPAKTFLDEVERNSIHDNGFLSSEEVRELMAIKQANEQRLAEESSDDR